MKVEESRLFHLSGMKHGPDLSVELRPDKKRLVIRQGAEEEIWVDLADIHPLCELLTQIVKETRLSHVIGG